MSQQKVAFLLVSFLVLAMPATAQTRAVDAEGISVELLYHPAVRIEATGGALLFRGREFTYRWEQATGKWHVTREKTRVEVPDLTSYTHATSGITFCFRAESSDGEGILTIFQGASERPLARLVLWNRERLAELWLERWQRNNPTTLAQLRKELEPAEPGVAGVADDGAYLWIAVGFYAGEGVRGRGTLIRLNPVTGESRVFQPPLLAFSSFTHIVAANGALWLGTQHEGEGFVESTLGLARFDPETGQVKSSLENRHGIIGNLVTSLYAAPNALWVATDAGICRLALPSEAPECWRIVPRVTLMAAALVSNRPGGPPRGKLPAGNYEVRWATTTSFEVITPDAVEGWMETHDLRDFWQGEFDARPFDLSNTYDGGAREMCLLEKPERSSLAATQVYRVPLYPVGEANLEGWQRVRANVGWIPRVNLGVTPAIERATHRVNHHRGLKGRPSIATMDNDSHTLILQAAEKRRLFQAPSPRSADQQIEGLIPSGLTGRTRCTRYANRNHGGPDRLGPRECATCRETSNEWSSLDP